jgi:hypothetical protein
MKILKFSLFEKYDNIELTIDDILLELDLLGFYFNKINIGDFYSFMNYEHAYRIKKEKLPDSSEMSFMNYFHISEISDIVNRLFNYLNSIGYELTIVDDLYRENKGSINNELDIDEFKQLFKSNSVYYFLVSKKPQNI